MYSSREFEVYTAPEYQRVHNDQGLAAILADGIVTDSKSLILEFFTERDITGAIEYYDLFKKIHSERLPSLINEVRQLLIARGYKEISDATWHKITDYINSLT